MEVCVFRALTDIGVADDKAEVVVKALGDEMDKRVENGVHAEVSAMRSDIATLIGKMSSDMATLAGKMSSDLATLSGEMSSKIAALSEKTSSDIAALSEKTSNDIATLSGKTSSDIATLTGEIKRLDEKIDKSIAHFRWAAGFVLVVCSSVATFVWRFTV